MTGIRRLGFIAATALLGAATASHAALIGLVPPDPDDGWPFVAMYDIAVSYDPGTPGDTYGLLTATTVTPGVSTLDLVGPPSMWPSPSDHSIDTMGSFSLTAYVNKSTGLYDTGATGTLLIKADLTAAPGLETTLYGSQRLANFGWDDTPGADWGFAGEGSFEFEYLDDETPGDLHLLADIDWPARVILVPGGLWDAAGGTLSAPDFNIAFTNYDPNDAFPFPLGKADAFPEPASALLLSSAGVCLLIRRRSRERDRGE